MDPLVYLSLWCALEYGSVESGSGGSSWRYLVLTCCGSSRGMLYRPALLKCETHSLPGESKQLLESFSFSLFLVIDAGLSCFGMMDDMSPVGSRGISGSASPSGQR